MADDVNILDADNNVVPVRADEVAGKKVQATKLLLGGDGVDEGFAGSANPVPVKAAALGDTNDTSAASDTGTFSLIALFKRLLTKIPGVGQATMAGSLPVVLASDQSTIAVSGTITANGPLTDTQLRATPVPVSGTVTATGPLTDTQLRAAAVPINGTVTVNAGTNTSTSALALESGGNLAAAATSLAAIDADIGAPADSAASSDTGTFSLIALFKRLLNTKMPSPLASEATVAGLLTNTQLRAADVPVSAASLPLPTGAATQATLANIDADIGAPADAAASSDSGSFSLIALFKRLLGKTADLLSRVPANDIAAPPVRLVGQEIWQSSFSQVGTTIAPELTTPFTGTGVSFSQGSGNLAIVAGTTANAEFFTRSQLAFQGSLRLRFGVVASQRIINNNLVVMLADLIGEGLNITINSATSITVAQTGHGFTAANVGQFVHIGRISGAAGVPGRYAIASIVDANSYNITVAGWPASGSCTATLFGRNYVRNIFNGTTATAVGWDTQRNGWATGDTTATINTTASPGTIINNEVQSREAYLYDQLRATSTTPTLVARASRVENIPDDNLPLYVFIWSFNGTTNPASSTTWTLSFVSVEKFANIPVYLQGQRSQGAVNPIPVQTQGTVPVSLATNTPTLAAGTNRAAFIASAGIWYDDSSTTLAANATFTGTSRDATVTATATAFANAATYAQELRVSAESDVTGTLWIEVSRDNTNWRRIKSVATAAVSGGGFYAEIVHAISWRYVRVGFTNGATIQARFSIGSIMVAA